MRGTSRLCRVLVVALVVLAGPAGAPLIAQEAVGTVIDKVGELTETRLPDGPAQPMNPSDPVLLETRLDTGILSSAKLLFGREQVLEMGSRAAVAVRREELPEGDVEHQFSQLSGDIRYFFATLASPATRVETSETTLIRSGTAFVVRAERRKTTVWVLEGRLEVQPKHGGSPVQVDAGEMTVVRRGRGPTTPAPFDPKSGATGSGALPPPFDRPPEEHFDPPTFPVPPQLPPRRGIDPPDGRGPP